MARIKLSHEEVREGRLPRLCMRCGAPATIEKRKTFSWCPSWVAVLILVGLLPYLIVMLILTKRMTVFVPLCDKHRNHWLWRTALVLALVAVLVGLIVVGIMVISAAAPQEGGLGGTVCVAGLLGLIVCPVIAWLILKDLIRPEEITDRTITLVKVHPNFVRAIEQMDEQAEERWRERRRRPARRAAEPEDRDAYRTEPPDALRADE